MRNLIVTLFLMASCVAYTNVYADTVTPQVATVPAVTQEVAATPVATIAQAATAPAAAVPAPGWGPQVIATASAFYFNGQYKVFQGSPMVGPAYTWDQSGSVNSAGFFVGPSIVSVGGVTTTTINVLAHIGLFETSIGKFGAGVGTEFWRSNAGVKPTAATSFFTLDYGF